MPPKPKDKTSPVLAIRDNQKNPWYKYCFREDGEGCLVDISCTLIKYVSSPMVAIVWGIRVFHGGPLHAPMDVLAVISLLLCNRWQTDPNESKL